jgi:hypothetical protein
MRLDRSIAFGGRVFVAGREYDVDARTEQAITARFAAIDAANAPVVPSTPVAADTGADTGTAPNGAPAGTGDAEGTSLDALTELDASVRELLVAADLTTIDAVEAVDDDRLMQIEGIGAARVRQIRAAIDAYLAADGA